MRSGFKMKGMNFGNSPVRQDKSVKADFSIDAQAYQNAINDYDVDIPSKAQIAAAKAAILAERKITPSSPQKPVKKPKQFKKRI